MARGEIADAIRAALGDRPATGIVAGLAVGLAGRAQPEQWRVLARSGTSHLMAISGMHIGMLAAWLRLARRPPCSAGGSGAARCGAQRDAAVMAGALAALGYALLAGWSVPTQRTVIMIALAAACAAAAPAGRRADALALGAIAVLAVRSAGAARGRLLAVVRCRGGRSCSAPPGTFARRACLRGYARVQMAVTLGLVPVLAGSFGSVSLVSALVNLYAIPLYTLRHRARRAGRRTAVALVLRVQAGACVDWSRGLRSIELTWPLIAVPAGWPLATWGIAALVPVAVVGASLVGLSRRSRRCRRRVASPVWCWLSSLRAWRAPPPAAGAVHFAVLDVGQGLAAVVETRRHVLVYDTGPAFRSGSDTGLLVVEPYLRSRGVRTIDMLVASHDDDDHAGGAQRRWRRC